MKAGVTVDRMFRAFSDLTRLRILHLLQDHREVCVGDLVGVLRAPQTTVSRHLAYLRRAGLVRVRKDGLWKHYALAAAEGRLHRRLLQCLGGCFEEVRDLAADRRRYERLKRCCPAKADRDGTRIPLASSSPPAGLLPTATPTSVARPRKRRS